MDKPKLRSLLSFLESFSKCFQTLTKADLLPLHSSLPYELLNLYYSQANLKENITSSHYKQYLFPQAPNEPLQQISFFPQAEGFPFISYSPKRTYKAVLQSFPNQADKTKKRITLEIYNHETLIRSLNLDEMHESVLNNSMVGSPLIWSQDENKIAYIAELKSIKRTGFFDSYNPLVDEQLNQAQENYLYEPDYGEKLENITKTSIFIYDHIENTLKQVILPYEKLFVTNPDFPDYEGKTLLFCGFISNPVKFGILHCLNRPAKIYHLLNPKYLTLFPKKTDTNEDISPETVELKDLNVLIESYDTCIKPLISPDRKKVAYFGSPLNAPHLNILALNVYDFEKKKDECLIPIVTENVFLTKKAEEINNSLENFSGIAGFYDTLEKIYWFSGSKKLVFQSISGVENGIFLVDVDSKALTKITPQNKFGIRGNNWTILHKDPFTDVLVASHENMKDAIFPKLAFVSNLQELLNGKTSFNEINSKAQWTILQLNAAATFQNSIEKLFQDKFKEKTLKHGQAEGLFLSLEDYDRFSPEYSEFFPEESKPDVPKTPVLKPLILNLHGGPHGNFAGNAKLRIFMLLRGYNMLLPNFSGSCGYGQKHLENLMTKIGEIDVEEIMGMVKQLIDEKLCDPKKIIIIGGSYGGYLSGTFATHPLYSSYFKAAILLNPVVNIPFMMAISDIPEWSQAVACNKKMDQWDLKSEDIKRMYEMSPISRQCKIPCLLLLGAKDRRVPYRAGLAFRNKALAEGGRVETFVYPESDHALSENPKVEYDVYAKILVFCAKEFEEN